MIIMWLLSGVSCALARRTSIACSKKCRIISSTRSRKVEINLLMMIQGFYSLRILRGNKDNYIQDITQWREDMIFIFEW